MTTCSPAHHSKPSIQWYNSTYKSFYRSIFDSYSLSLIKCMYHCHWALSSLSCTSSSWPHEIFESCWVLRMCDWTSITETIVHNFRCYVFTEPSVVPLFPWLPCIPTWKRGCNMMMNKSNGLEWNCDVQNGDGSCRCFVRFCTTHFSHHFRSPCLYPTLFWPLPAVRRVLWNRTSVSITYCVPIWFLCPGHSEVRIF